ncbi:hypothetical protein ACHAXH_005808 [Discostella pseudostelligera]
MYGLSSSTTTRTAIWHRILLLAFYFALLIICDVAAISSIESRATTISSSKPTHPPTMAFVKASKTMGLKGTKNPNNNAATATSTTSASSATVESSSVLRELKETIKSQAAEIEQLKKVLTATKKLTGGHAHGGHHGAAADSEDAILEYKLKPFYSIAYERVGWLALFLLSLSFTAIIMNGFEHTLSKQIELAYFVPLMAGHGGNTGGQAVGTVLSALSAGVITREDSVKVITKEALSGLVMGVMLGAIVGPISHYVMGISQHVSTVVSVTFPLLSTIAAFLGSSLPFVCVMLGLNPAVIAAPAMTSFVDVSGLLCYFLIANKIFKLFGLEL